MTSVADGAADSLALAGNPATIQCGGFDDNQHVVDTSEVEVIHSWPVRRSRVFPLPTVSGAPYQTIQPQQLAAYIRVDKDTPDQVLRQPPLRSQECLPGPCASAR